MKPRLIIAAIAGGMAGIMTAIMTGAGLVSTPSPGSIFAYLAVTPREDYLPVHDLITVRLPLEQALDAFGIVARGEAIKVTAPAALPAPGPRR